MLPADLPEHLCTQSELARLLGIKHPNITQAKKSGKLPPECFEKFKGVEYVIRQKAIDELAKHWTSRGNYSPQKAVALQELASDSDEDDLDGVKDEIKKKNSMSRVRDNKLLYETQLLKIKVEQESGKVVSKEAAGKALFEMGREFRDRFAQLPNRIIDDILSAETRHESVQILETAIYEVLKDIYELPTRFAKKIDGK